MLGLVVGALVAITGASGILIIVPVLSSFTYFFYNIPMPIILGVSLVVDVIASLSVASTYAAFKNVKVRGIQWILLGSFFGAVVSSRHAIDIPKELVIIIISIGMIGFGLRMMKKDKIGEGGYRKKLGKPFWMILLGGGVGITTGLFGAGGGVMIFLVLHTFFKFSPQRAVGTSTFIMFFTALFGASGYIMNGNIDFSISLMIGIPAAIMGVIISFIINTKLSEKVMKSIIGWIFISSSLVMFIAKIVVPFLKQL